MILLSNAASVATPGLIFHMAHAEGPSTKDTEYQGGRPKGPGGAGQFMF